MELPLLVDFLYINGGWVPNKLAAGTCWKCALARSPWLPQPPTICYHGKLSVRAVPPLYHSAVKTPLHCKTLKTHHLSLQPSLFLSTRDSLRCYFFFFFFKSANRSAAEEVAKWSFTFCVRQVRASDGGDNCCHSYCATDSLEERRQKSHRVRGRWGMCPKSENKKCGCHGDRCTPTHSTPVHTHTHTHTTLSLSEVIELVN